MHKQEYREILLTLIKRKGAERRTSIKSCHFSSGKSSIGDTC